MKCFSLMKLNNVNFYFLKSGIWYLKTISVSLLVTSMINAT